MSFKEKKEDLPGRGLLHEHLHQYKRRLICRHRLGLFTSNQPPVGVQTPMGICAFVKLQVVSRTALRFLLAQAKAFNNLVIPIRVSPVEIVQQAPPLVYHHD